LGILGRAGKPDRFVYVGIDDAAGALIGPGPDGIGVLGAVVDDAEPMRLDDVTAHPVFAGFPPDHPPMRTFLGAPIRWGGEVLGRLYLTDKTGGRVFTDDDEVTVKAVAEAVGVAMNYAREIEEARRGKQWLEAAGDVSTGLLSETDPDRAMRVIAGRARELSASDTAMVLLPSDHGIDPSVVTHLRVAVCLGVAAEVLLDLMIPVTGSTSGDVLADKTARRVTGLTYRPPGVPVVLGPAMIAPLTPGDTASVLIVVRVPGSAAFDDDDLTQLTVFAENAALALHLASTRRRRELRVLADRDQLARDLYDHVMQQLFSVGLAMQITRRRPGAGSETRMVEHVDQVQSVIREVRQAIFDLPSAGADFPRVRTSLAQMITSLTADAPQRVSLRMTGPLDDLPGTSKWNKIEHRLFSQIYRQPGLGDQIGQFTFPQQPVAVGARCELARPTADQPRSDRQLDGTTYETGIKVTDCEMRQLETQHLTRHDFHGDWNYCVRPATPP
jgi:GAF domain-containing protein